jgi:2-polyprenyl-6-methoxyphenol hydroxylase-like FAD-dependent oxidoreductase
LQVGETELGFLVENNLIQAALLQSLSAMPNVETHYGAKVTGITLVCGGHIHEQISLHSTIGQREQSIV